jgi:hypothetical protein
LAAQVHDGQHHLGRRPVQGEAVAHGYELDSMGAQFLDHLEGVADA